MEQFRRHLDVANRFLDAAKVLLKSSHYESAVSRVYYALFNATIVLVAVRAGQYRPRWDHIALHRAFTDNFAKRGFLFSRKDSEDYQAMLNLRVNIDYHHAAVRQKDAKELVARVEELVARMRTEAESDTK